MYYTLYNIQYLETVFAKILQMVGKLAFKDGYTKYHYLRSALLALIGGSLTYIVLSPQKIRSFKFLFFASILLVLTSPLYYPVFKTRYEARQQKVSMTFDELDEEEARIYEINITFKHFFDAKIGEKLFGNDLFLGRDLFGSGRKRMMHVDYMNLLIGAGIIRLACLYPG